MSALQKPLRISMAKIVDARGALVGYEHAEQIVREMNAFDDLLAACEQAVIDIENWEAAVREIIHCDPQHGMDLSKMKAAIAKAKEAPSC